MASTPPAEDVTSTSPTASTSAADDARARREARKARILSKGNDRLSKLTKQARGDDAEMLYPSSPAKAQTPQPSQSMALGEEDPDEVDISRQAQMDEEVSRAMQMFQARKQQDQQQQQPQQQQQMDPFAQMMAALSGGGGSPDGSQAPPGMPDLSQLFAALQGQMGGEGGPEGAAGGFPPGFPPQQQQQQQQRRSGRSFTDRLFSLVHIVVFALLGFLAIYSTLHSGSSPGQDQGTRDFFDSFMPQGDDSTAQATEKIVQRNHAVEARVRYFKWAALAYYRPNVADGSYFQLDPSWIGLGLGSSVPIFHLFLAVTIVLQTTRILLFSAKPPPSSMLYTIASQLPVPRLQFAVKTGAKYLGLLNTVVDDVAVLIFTLGMGVLGCAYMLQSDPAVKHGLVQ
ncbi:unnamed protein product [Jaminaea pallidilutea]